MGWINILCETYDNVYGTDTANKAQVKLLPRFHTTQNAEIEVTVDMQGNFVDALVVPKEDRITFIPCTDESAGRTSGAAKQPHPLHDKLQFTAGDYETYGGTKGSEAHICYTDKLRLWCESEYTHPYIQAVYTYIQKKHLIADLVAHKILFTDTKGRLLKKWEGKESEKPPIFSVITGEQSEAFVRFAVRAEKKIDRIKLWEHKEIEKNYVGYALSTGTEKGLCYATGAHTLLTYNHPKKIRHARDSAKLISANDNTGFTFRGRFINDTEAMQVGYEVSQKAHNVLKWLIQNQGTFIGDKVFVCWGTYAPAIPDTLAASCVIDEMCTLNTLQEETQKKAGVSLQSAFAAGFNRALHGYRANIRSGEHIAVLCLDAATPGRMSVGFYREINSAEISAFFDSIADWHIRAGWFNSYYDFKKKKTVYFVGAPSLQDIAAAAFDIQHSGNSSESNKRLMASTVQRLLPCVIQKETLPPFDIVQAVYIRSCRPLSYTKAEWQKQCGIACSLIKAYRNKKYKENWTMETDEKSRDVTYNLGRLLAVLDEIEARCLYRAGEKRSTTVMNYFSKFAERPNRTLGIIQKQLMPYRRKLEKMGNDLYTLEKQISSLIPPEELFKASHLDGRFLLGFNAQKHALFTKKNKDTTTDIVSETTQED